MDGIALFFLPTLLGIGWLAYLGWLLNLPGALVLITAMVATPILLQRTVRHRSWDLKDLRWAAAPLVTCWMFLSLGWFHYTLAWADAVMHLFEAATYLGPIDSIHPTNRAYRSPVVPSLLSFELLLGQDDDSIMVVPFLLTMGAAWQVQCLGERVGTAPFAAVAAMSFLMLPTTRYWGQMAMADVASAGLWVVLLHALLHADRHRFNTGFARLTGSLAGLIFLTKSTYLYALGIAGWLLLIDRSTKRPFAFLQGWTIVVIPWMIHHTVAEGHPFSPILGQIQFTVESSTGVVDSHTPASFQNSFLKTSPAGSTSSFYLACGHHGGQIQRSLGRGWCSLCRSLSYTAFFLIGVNRGTTFLCMPPCSSLLAPCRLWNSTLQNLASE